jgi:plasmid stabilization system protein ParE
LPRVRLTKQAEVDLEDIWLHIAQENPVAADGIKIIRVLHCARDVDVNFSAQSVN